MTPFSKKHFLCASLLTILVAGTALGQTAARMDPIPLKNWKVPSIQTMFKAYGSDPIGNTQVNPGAFIFQSVIPCRVVDTRQAVGPFGGPIFGVAETRAYSMANGGRCGSTFPANIAAVSINITVTQTAGTGFVTGYATGGTLPGVASITFIGAGVTLSNAAIVPTAGGSASNINIYASQSTHVILDINGIFLSDLSATGDQLFITTSVGPTAAIRGQNNSTGAAADGGLFITASGASSSAGVVGQAIAVSGTASGVLGITGSNTNDTAGVRGLAGPPNIGSLNFQRAGVRGESGGGLGLLGLSNFIGAEGFLLDGSGNALASGLLGSNLFSRTSGVHGFLYTGAGDTAGVLGINGTGSPVPLPTGFSTAGVRGEGDLGTGVLGISRSNGVVGNVYDSNGALRGSGYLGTLSGSYYAVRADGDFAATGSKSFIEPHPADASKVIVYSALESREVGTYFRGTARVQGGLAVVELPEDFRIVTDEEGLTVQLTPIRSFASMYVESEDLHQIVVRSSKDVTFHYLVQGVRRAFKDFKPVRNGEEFMPPSATSRMPGYLTEEARQRLFANGTYNPDGTVNLETAERVGWTRTWREREEQTKTAAERARTAAGLAGR